MRSTRKVSRRRAQRRPAGTLSTSVKTQPRLLQLIQVPQPSPRQEDGLLERVMSYYSPNAMNTIRLLRPVLATPNAPGVIQFAAGALTGIVMVKAFVDSVEGVERLVRRL